ncbi:MAG: AAA family ATPase, partial [Nakamurella multipartita]
MSRSLYIASPEALSGKSAVALGLVDLLSRRVGRVGVFRPIVNADPQRDSVVELLIAQPGIRQDYDEAVGVTYAQWHADQDAALSRIVDRFGELSAEYDAVV